MSKGLLLEESGNQTYLWWNSTAVGDSVHIDVAALGGTFDGPGERVQVRFYKDFPGTSDLVWRALDFRDQENGPIPVQSENGFVEVEGCPVPLSPATWGRIKSERLERWLRPPGPRGNGWTPVGVISILLGPRLNRRAGQLHTPRRSLEQRGTKGEGRMMSRSDRSRRTPPSSPVVLLLLLVLLSLLVLGLVTCRTAERGPASLPADRGTTPATSGPQVGGVFRYAESSDLPALDPVRVDDTASTHAATQIFDGLVALDRNLEIEPALATHWLIADDGLSWTFHLRADARYHDDPCFPRGKGRLLVAADLKSSFERLCDPRSGSTGFWIFSGKIRGADAFNRGETRHVEGFEVVDPHTLRIHLIRPYAPLLRLLSMPYTLIVPPEAVATYGDELNQHPVGTGPFRLASWTPGRGMRLVRHEGYWGRDADGRRLPYLDAVEVRFIGNSAGQVTAFEAGKLDMLYPIPPRFFQQLVVPEGGVRTGVGNYVIQSSPALDVQYLGFRMDLPPFAGNRALRQAFNYAVDRESLVRDVLRRGRPAHSGVLPPGLPGFNRELRGYRFDLERARALMREAGYADGTGLPELTLQVNAGGTATVDVAEAVAAQLGRLGVRVKVHALPWPEHLRLVETSDVPFFRMAWLADYPDPENFLALFLQDNHAPIGPNSTRYSNPEFDQLVLQALATTNDEERTALYHRAESLVVEDAPWLFLFYAESYRLIQSWVRGFPINSLDYRDLKRVWRERS